MKKLIALHQSHPATDDLAVFREKLSGTDFLAKKEALAYFSLRLDTLPMADLKFLQIALGLRGEFENQTTLLDGIRELFPLAQCICELKIAESDVWQQSDKVHWAAFSSAFDSFYNTYYSTQPIPLGNVIACGDALGLGWHSSKGLYARLLEYQRRIYEEMSVFSITPDQAKKLVLENVSGEYRWQFSDLLVRVQGSGALDGDAWCDIAKELMLKEGVDSRYLGDILRVAKDTLTFQHWEDLILFGFNTKDVFNSDFLEILCYASLNEADWARFIQIGLETATNWPNVQSFFSDASEHVTFSAEQLQKFIEIGFIRGTASRSCTNSLFQYANQCEGFDQTRWEAIMGGAFVGKKDGEIENKQSFAVAAALASGAFDAEGIKSLMKDYALHKNFFFFLGENLRFSNNPKLQRTHWEAFLDHAQTLNMGEHDFDKLLQGAIDSKKVPRSFFETIEDVPVGLLIGGKTSREFLEI